MFILERTDTILGILKGLTRTALMIEELISSYRELRAYLTSKLRNAEDAADIAQSSFERVYSYANAHGNQIDSPRALLFKTANNIRIDIIRHNEIVSKWSEEQLSLHTESHYLSAQDHFEHQQLIAKITTILNGIPERRREVFILFKVYGYSQTEIAQRLNITEATVSKHVIRVSVSCAKAFAELNSSS